MKSIVLDTNILIDHVHGFATWLDELLRQDIQLIIPTIVRAEYLTALENKEKANLKESQNYLNLFENQDFTLEIADILGEMLREKSYPASAGTADLIVAATAVYLDVPLATRNRADFAKILNLRFFEPEDCE